MPEEIMKVVCIFSGERSGTNHLCRLLTNFPELRVYEELFNKRGTFTLFDDELAAVSELSGETYSSYRDERLVAFSRSEPKALLRLLQDLNARKGKSAIVFKIFPGQMDTASIHTEILNEFACVPVILMRQMLDSYISFKKALTTDRWTSADTTSVRVGLEVRELERWVKSHRAWFGHWDDHFRASGAVVPFLLYERDLNGRTPEEVLSKFSEFVGQTAGLTLKAPKRMKNIGLPRQDLATSVEAKVSNWEEFTSTPGAKLILESSRGYPV